MDRCYVGIGQLFMKDIKGFEKWINTPQKVVLTMHHKPDADALGSALGFAGYLKLKGHDVSVVAPTDYPSFLYWMSGNEAVLIYSSKTEAAVRDKINGADVIVCLDFNSLSRINELGTMVAEAPGWKAMVDHHLEPDDFADVTFWDTGAAATAELVYEIIEGLGDVGMINAAIAEALYAGIMTDTGSFKHPNTTKNVFRICAELVSIGANTSKVATSIYDTNSVDRVKFLGFALNERLKINLELKTAYFCITREDLKRFNSKTGDTEGLVNYALSIEGINFAALIIDRTEAVKMSFRSTGSFSVNEFAKKHFNGGGHKNAAGGRSEDSLQVTVEKFESLLLEYKSELNPIKETIL